MAKTELSNSKSLCVLGVVVCCFAILWPKIFLPMFQSALTITSTSNENYKSDILMLPPKIRQAMKMSRPEQLRRLPGRPFQSDNKLNTNEIPRTAGLMAFVMPLYTIGIVVFFLYTILKMVFKNKSENDDNENELELNENKSFIKDFQMDPEYRNETLDNECKDKSKEVKYQNLNKKTKQNLHKKYQKSDEVLRNYGKDKVSKALHVLIRDMEEFKAKLLEVEQTRQQIKENRFTEERQNWPNICSNQREENENKIQEQKDRKEVNEENTTKDNENEENKEKDEQNKSESEALDSDNEFTEENGVNEDTEHLLSQEEYEFKEKLVQNLESYYWESLLKGMNDLKNLKEE